MRQWLTAKRRSGLTPSFAKAHLNLASALAAEGSLAEARAEFGEALRLNPDLAEAREALARMTRN